MNHHTNNEIEWCDCLPTSHSSSSSSSSSTTWYYNNFKTPKIQTVVVGIIFFLVFTSYTTIQFYSRSIYGETLSSSIVSTIYITFTISSIIIAPTITNKYGCRSTMTVGILGYAIFVITSLIYFQYGTTTTNDGTTAVRYYQYLLITGGAILGIGASLLWTAQGRLILEYGKVAAATTTSTEAFTSDNDNDGDKDDEDVLLVEKTGTGNHKSTSSSGEGAGSLMGIFWAVFQCSSLVGGTLSFVYYSHTNENDEESSSSSSTWLYVIFLGFILLGALSTQLLLSPSVLWMALEQQQQGEHQGRRQRGRGSTSILELFTLSPPPDSNDNDDVLVTEETQLLEPPPPSLPIEPPNQNDHTNTIRERFYTNEMKTLSSSLSSSTASSSTSPSHSPPLLLLLSSWWKEVQITIRHIFLDKSMLFLSMLFFYTGFNQPYQQSTFGNRFFTKRSIGIILIIFHSMEILGAIYCGQLLDHHRGESQNSNSITPTPTTDTVGKKQKHKTKCNTNRNQISNNTTNYNTDNNGRHQKAILCLTLFIVVNTTGNLLAFYQELTTTTITISSSSSSSTLTSDIVVALDILQDWKESIIPAIAFACWGFADAQIQVYCYWLIGETLYETGDDHARAVAYYKCLQSLGVSIGFYLTPLTRLGAINQLILSTVIYTIGTLLAFWELPPAARSTSHHS